VQDLVWTGFNRTHHMLGTMGFALCEFEEQPHLCFAHYVLDNPIHNDIMNASYDVIRSVWPSGKSDDVELEPDLHEFNFIKGSSDPVIRSPNVHRESTAIISSAATRKLPEPFTWDRCETHVDWVKSSVFQEVSLQGDNKVLFQWDSYDHVPIDDSVNCPGHDEVWMNGDSDYSPFDHFHLNAVDKDENGDYYLSARHTSTLYKVSGEDGRVLWQLGKKHPDFQKVSEVEGVGFEFAFQHNLRLHPDYPGADLAKGLIALSLFDNANEDYDFHDRVANFSAGKIILVDENTRTATLKEAYTLYIDDKHQLSTNQGSFQLLPNGNRIVGGGNIQEVIEWQPGSFDPVFRAHWGDWENDEGQVGHKINSYRSLRYEWVGRPETKPDVFAYAPSCGPRMTVYVSWNGATEVASWAFWGSATQNGTFQSLASTNRTSFESSANTLFANYVYAVALDAQGAELGRSDPIRASVLDGADEFARMQCGPLRCQQGFNYKKRAAMECPPADLAAELESAGATLNVQPERGSGVHCDPCFGPYKRWVA
jgi:hypothetical protein